MPPQKRSFKKKSIKKQAPKKTASKNKKAVKKQAKHVKAKITLEKKAKSAVKSATLSVFDVKGKALESVALDALFQGEQKGGVVYQSILMYQAGEREGTASTKNRGDVRGGGKKPWKQKGTGQARHGSRRSPIWRGGGVTFGPSPRDYSYVIPHQIRRQAVADTVKEKAAIGKLVLVNELELKAPKTGALQDVLDAFKLSKPLIVVEKKTENLLLASRNLSRVSVKTAQEVNALDVASHTECLMTKPAYTGLIKRLKA